MNNTSPFSFLQSLASSFQPPVWAVDEVHQRLVLFLNHVLLQERAAQDRLLRQKGRFIQVKWGLFAVDLVVTPAGLVDRAVAPVKPDMLLSVVGESPLLVLQSVMAGKAPPVKIEGDVQLAAEIGWLAENLRWDAEEDLSRLIGDAPAHAVADAGRRLLAGLKQFLAQAPLFAESYDSPTDADDAPERQEEPTRAMASSSSTRQETEAKDQARQFSDGSPSGTRAPDGSSAEPEATSVGANTPLKASE